MLEIFGDENSSSPGVAHLNFQKVQSLLEATEKNLLSVFQVCGGLLSSYKPTCTFDFALCFSLIIDQVMIVQSCWVNQKRHPPATRGTPSVPRPLSHLLAITWRRLHIAQQFNTNR